MVGVSSAGNVVGGGSGIGGGIVYQATLGIGGIPARIIHGLAIVADAEFKVAWVVVAVAAVVTGADVVAAVVHCPACGVVFEVSGTVLWGLCLRLRYRHRIAIIYACDAGSFSCSVAICFGFCVLDRLGSVTMIDGAFCSDM